MIEESVIQEIKDRLDIVEVVGDFVSLKKSGSSYKALSPFTTEKTPSFFVFYVAYFCLWEIRVHRCPGSFRLWYGK